jgi:Ca2+-binding RTX toxin-like protein
VAVNLNLTVAQNTVGAGTDTLLSVENLVGSNLNDTLLGNGGNNILSGGGGTDSLNGGAGIDTASYSSATAGVTVNLGLTTAQNTVGAGIDTLLNLENLTGSNFDDTLIGNTGNNVLNGVGGIDTVSYANAGGAVTVNLGLTTAQNTVGAGTDTLVNVENLAGSNFNDTLTGNSSANVVSGGGGNDSLDGGVGTDTASYSGATAGVTVNLGLTVAQNTVGAGTDTVLNFENLTGSNFNDTLIGNAASNVLTGGGGVDTFVLNTKVSADIIADFVSGIDKFSVSQVGIKVGDGDHLVEGGTTVVGPGGFASTAELVVVSGNIVGTITASSAAAAIGSATAAYAVGATTLFAVDNGTQTGLFLFTSNGADALVSASELTLLGTATATPATALGDYLFVA